MLCALRFLGLGSLLAAAGCTVYAPIQPVVPLVSQRGQAEAGANLQPIGRLEATAAYSPLAHLVLAGTLTGAPRLGSEQFLVTRQYEAGAGYYQPLGQHWLLSTLGGVGQAYCHRGYLDLALFGRGSFYEYQARYAKYFGQVGLVYIGPLSKSSLTYRLVKVDFNYLTSSTAGPLPLPGMLRHELAYAVRTDVARRWKVAFATGFSVSSTAKLDDEVKYPTYDWAAYHANRTLLPAFFLSLGVLFQPDRETK